MSDLGQKLIAETRKLAAANPEFVYPQDEGGCVYLRDGAPSCLIGHALWNVGLIDARWEGDDRYDSSIFAVISQEGWPIEVREVNWLSTVQDIQDSGAPWGRAIEGADTDSPHMAV